MPKMRYTAEDLLRGTLIEEAAWYPTKVSKIEEAEADTDKSQNVIVHLTILDGKYKGVPLMRYFNEKAPGFIKDYAEACGFSLNEKGGDFDFDATLNKVIDTFVEQRKDNKGNLQNNCARFRKRLEVVG
jgi:hypothetical protein